MRHASVLAGVAVATLVLSSGAHAQSLFGGSGSGSWTGAYIGAQAELLATKSLEEQEPGLTAPTLLGDMGAGGGVFGGYDYQFNDMFVAGIGGEYNLDSTELLSGGANSGASKWDATIKARVGTPIAPNVLAYASLGYEWGHFDYSDRPTLIHADNADFTTGGLQIALGVDAMLTQNIMGRLEASYTHYDSHITTISGTPAVQSTPSMIAVKGGIGFRFN
jgi:opacity protein-like surface antigen